MDSIHGRALLKMGLIVAPSCNDCHGVHDIKRSVDRNSPINHANVAKTCGKCHVGVEEIYNKSVHGQLLAKGDERGPVCTDCHTAHEIETPANGHFKMASDQRCGKCHEDRLEHYRDTYHGKAMALGKPNVASDVAACYDCHGHHDVLPPSNPASRLSTNQHRRHLPAVPPGRQREVHRVLPHANPLDGKNYPGAALVFLFMTALLIGVVRLLRRPHRCSGWSARSSSTCTTRRRSARPRSRPQTDDEWFTRFTPFERFLHFLVVTSFLLLVITGMPLKFYYTDWAKAIFNLIGGAETWPARCTASAPSSPSSTSRCTSLSLVGSSWQRPQRSRATRRPASFSLQAHPAASLFGPDSMMPTLQDWRDFVAHKKWFFGKGPKPQFDRWTYWEKFDYFAVFWGVSIIGALRPDHVVPQFFTRFLPGWMINIALIVHSTRRCWPPASSSPSTSSTPTSASRSSRWTPSSSPAASPRPRCCTSASAGTTAWSPRAGSTSTASATNGNAGRASPAPSATSSSASAWSCWS